MSLRNIKDINDGSEASILELITTLSFRLAGVVQVQSWTPMYKASALYVTICARNTGFVGGVPSNFVKGGRCGHRW